MTFCLNVELNSTDPYTPKINPIDDSRSDLGQMQKLEVKRCEGINLKSSTSFNHEFRGLIELLQSPKKNLLKMQLSTKNIKLSVCDTWT